MKINKIEIQNFFSIDKISIDFDKYKNNIVLLDGINKDSGGSNGVGKSSIGEAIVWSLTGKTIRKITSEDNYINSIKKSSCIGKIIVNDNITIIRQRSPTKLTLFKNNINITKKDAFETQEEINRLLNLNHKTLLATSFFGQHNEIDFISSPIEYKREIIKNFLSLDEIFELRKKARSLKTNYNSDLQTIEASIKDNDKNLNSLKDKINKIEKNKVSLSSMEGISISLIDILKLEEKRKELSFLYQNKKNSKNALIQRKRDVELQLESSIRKCNLCGSTTKLSQEELNKLTKELEQISFTTIDEELKSIELELSTIKIPITSSKYKDLEDLRSLNREIDIYKNLSKEYSVNGQNLSKKYKDHYNLKNIYTFWEDVFSEEGIVKFIINNILEYFNDQCNNYLSYFSGGTYKIVFDSSLGEKIFVNDKETFYQSLSGGERKRINLAVFLALQSLLKINEKIEQNNFVFFDEVADSLDTQGLDGLYILLQELRQHYTVFIITHSTYLKSILDGYTDKLTVVKKNGLSTLLENTI